MGSETPTHKVIAESFTDYLRQSSKIRCCVGQCEEEVMNRPSSLRVHVQECHADVVALGVTEDSLIHRIQCGPSERKSHVDLSPLTEASRDPPVSGTGGTPPQTKKVRSPRAKSGSPRRARARHRAPTSGPDFRRASNPSDKRLWDPTDGRATPRPRPQAAPKVAPSLEALEADDEPNPYIRQPETRPISQEQLVAEVKGIYAGLVMVESKCIEVDNAQSSQSETKLNNEQWQALIALHRTLLHEHHDFFLASQHPSASPALRRLALKYAMPARMWRHGIHSFLELLRHRLPSSLEHMLTFIYLAYSMMALLYETVPAFHDTWIECLGDLGRYRMAIEDDDIRDREIWTNVSRHWYSGGSDRTLTANRRYNHPGSARETIMTLFDPLIKSSQPRMFQTSGTLNGIPIEANADTGSTHNFISEEYATAIGLQVESYHGNVRLPNGKAIPCLGRVQGSFRFEGETKTYSLSCLVLESVAHGLVFGQRFLTSTRTFEDHMETRLRRVFSTPQRVSMKLVDTGHQDYIPGYLDGALCCAVPDSGSDIMVISGSYAQARGFYIDRSPESRQLVEFIDGSTQLTDGMVRNLNWQFMPGEAPVQCDFVVMDGLPVDAILSNAMVDVFDVFRRYRHLLTATEPHDDDEAHIYDIRLRKQCREQIARLENTYAEDIRFMTSGGAFTPEILDRERARRGEISDRIQALTQNERQEHMTREMDRQAQFDRVYESWLEFCRRTFGTGGGQSSPTPNLQGAIVAPLSATSTATPGRNEWRQRFNRLWK